MTVDRRALLLGAAVAALGTATVEARAQDRAALTSTLIEIEIDSWQYTKDKNIAAMQNYLASEAVLIFGDGSRFTKAEFLKGLPTFRVDSFNVDRKSAEVLTVSPDVACLLYRVTYNQGTGPTTVLSSNTYVRRQGAWQSALYQETKVK